MTHEEEVVVKKEEEMDGEGASGVMATGQPETIGYSAWCARLHGLAVILKSTKGRIKARRTGVQGRTEGRVASCK